MIQNDLTLELLTTAAETIYKFVDKRNGFPSGKVELQSGKVIDSFNNFNGAKEYLESKLGRALHKSEITMLSLAIGFGPTPNLTEEDRKYSMEILWPKGNPDRRHVDLMRVLCAL